MKELDAEGSIRDDASVKDILVIVISQGACA